MSRGSATTETVVDAMLILTRGDEVLLAQRRDTGVYDGWLNLPSGKLEDGEDGYEGVMREAREEIGIVLERPELMLCGLVHCHYPDAGTRLGMFFHATYAPVRQGEPVNAEPHKCAGISWHRLDRLPARLVPYNAAGIGLYVNGGSFAEVDGAHPAPKEQPTRRGRTAGGAR